MSLLVAIQSAIFYYVACTPCNEARARHRAKKQARQDREEKMRIQMEQPGLYRHPSPYNTNPFWQEEIDIGPRLPKHKAGSKNTSQRGLNSAGTGRNSPSASLTCTSSNNDNQTATSSTMPGGTSGIPEEGQDDTFDEDGWNRRRYQREDEELWGHDFSRMGHKLVDNIVKAGNSAGRMIKGDLGKEKEVTEEDRSAFYFAPKNPPVNDYHPPIKGSAPPHKNALQWMLQPPPPAKVMEGRVPVNRAHSFGSMASRGSSRSAGKGGRHAGSEEAPLGRLVHERAMQERLRKQETPSESELIDALIGTRSRQTTVSSRGRSMRSRSLSFDSDRLSDRSTDGELVDNRRRRARARLPYQDTDDSDADDDDDDDEDLFQHRSRESLGSGRATGRAAQRPKLGTIRSSNSNATSLRALSHRFNESRNESVTPRPSSPGTPTTRPAALLSPADVVKALDPVARDENEKMATPVST